jgi:TetR/AcrR family transcriptional regulator
MGILERKEREKLQRRNDIVDAAEQVFFNKGIDSATMDDIAEVAELSKGTLYLYFKNKDELQYAIKIRASEMLNKMFKSNTSLSSDGVENIEAIGRSFIKFSHDRPDYFNLLLHFEGKSLENLDFENPFLIKFLEEDSPMLLFRDVIRMGQEDGSLREDIDPDIMAHDLWAMTTGVLHMLTHQKEILKACKVPGNDDDFIESLFAIIRQGIIKKVCK